MDSGHSRQADKAGFADVSRLLAPRSIATIGATDSNVGGATGRFSAKFNSSCAIDPVNPKRETVAGLHCYPDVASLPQPASLTILAVPKNGFCL